MEFKELFETGMTYGTFLSIGSETEVAKIEEITKNITISDDLVKALKAINKRVNLLLSAESWCPYVRATVPVLAKISQINEKIRLGIITEGRGFLFLRDKLGIEEDDYVIPTLAILDAEYKLIDKYVGTPEKYAQIGFENVSREFFKGFRAEDIVEEIIRKIG